MQRLKLINLYDGEYFTIPGLEKYQVNLQLISCNDTAATIRGYKRESINDNWQEFVGERVSATTEVIRVDKLIDIRAANQGIIKELSIDKEEQKRNVAAQKSEQEIAQKKNGRGRPSAVIELNFPSKNEVFTINNLKEANPDLPDYAIQNHINKLLKANKVKVVRTEAIGRGRATRFFSLVLE